MSKLFLFFKTVKYLKFRQIRYQIWYRLIRAINKLLTLSPPLSIDKNYNKLNFQTWIVKPSSYKQDKYTFLNHSIKYPGGSIEWNESSSGKLWSYNLNYMDFLLQESMTENTSFELIDNFIKCLPENNIGLEPYPISLRCINWIKLFSLYPDRKISKYSNSLYAQYSILVRNIEYHLMANHLLENGMSLLFGAYYFSDYKFYVKAKNIIETELEEQILYDGAHFELSPMYHQIILDRLLDCINLLKNNHRFHGQDNLLNLMIEKAQLMLNWINIFSFSDGQIPMVNDSASGISPTTKDLIDYAGRLGIPQINRSHSLSACSYRKFKTNNYECIIDIGSVSPGYQPGHSHADTFNFVLHSNNGPLIVDTGISTYNDNDRRSFERSTSAHNTVTVGYDNSSEVWSSFRVARRAKVELLSESDSSVKASHNGFRKAGSVHIREWKIDEDKFIIHDFIQGKKYTGIAHLWLSPGLVPQSAGSSVIVKGATINFENAAEIKLLRADIALGFNKIVDSYRIEIPFNNQLTTTFSFT